ncbi:unnamed protein product [Caenorhabditis angaria]|uniref:Uncharacterized protein n=1 Tax=Caenorhabditis angaria TaxID=860376 RepID=A0A9P1II97_9PELO|nr:unnamed protein product [Caenorhabditis angaria]
MCCEENQHTVCRDDSTPSTLPTPQLGPQRPQHNDSAATNPQHADSTSATGHQDQVVYFHFIFILVVEVL